MKGKNVTIIGYGSQGHAHAQNLNPSGVKVTVGLRKGGASWSKAEKAGLKVAEVSDAVKTADVGFILLLLALFVTAGGIYLEGNLHDSVFTNTVLLGVGAVLASIVGTTGAAMILIRPLIRANDNRRYNAHVVVFFIFLVANIGGALSPLGDPPLFIGFLKGVDFFWTTVHLWQETLVVGGIVLAIFMFLDIYFHHREGRFARLKDPDSPTNRSSCTARSISR